ADGRCAEPKAVVFWRNAITRTGGCCVRAASGHAAAAPPSSVMNARRLTLNIAGPPLFQRGQGYNHLRAGLPHVQPARDGPPSPLGRPELTAPNLGKPIILVVILGSWRSGLRPSSVRCHPVP